MATDPLAALALRHPIVLAPLGGGPSTPELVAAVCEAGGSGFLGAPYLSPEAIREAVRRIRALTARPFGINLFAGGWSEEPPPSPGPALALVAAAHASLGLPPPVVPAPRPDPFPRQLEAVLEARPAAFGFTFGIPPDGALAELRRRGIATFGTATCVREGELLAAAGVDAVVAQGAEAGGHRGTFAASRDEGLVPVLELTAALRRAVPLPVLAAGGVVDGAGLRATLRAGAAAALLGTAFLVCPEAGTAPAHRRALLEASAGCTILTRAFSGRWARGLANAFTAAVEGRPEAVLPYPAQNELTRPLRQAAAARGDPEHLSLWAGQGIGRLRPLPAAELVRTLAAELAAGGR